MAVPRVSIVTPSYNQAQFLEETILSVLNQDYPNIEYIVVDGGSTEGSVEIIQKYADRLAYWVSEKDNGQAHAINKGWRRATGDIIAYLNSDDIYYPGAIRQAVVALAEHPSAGMVFSDALLIDEHGETLRELFASPFDIHRLIAMEGFVPQPTAFIRRQVLDEVGLLDERLHMVMDYDLWVRLGLRYEACYLPDVHLAAQREHGTAKSTAQINTFALERYRALNKVFSRSDIPDSIRAIRSDAYAAASLTEAAHAAYAGEPARILPALLRAAATSPRYALRRPLPYVLLGIRGLVPWWTGKPSPALIAAWRFLSRAMQRSDPRGRAISATVSETRLSLEQPHSA